MVHGDGGRDQRCEAKVDGERDGPVADQPDPTVDERQHRLGAFRDLKRPIVRACRGRPARCELGQG